MLRHWEPRPEELMGWGAQERGQRCGGPSGFSGGAALQEDPRGGALAGWA